MIITLILVTLGLVFGWILFLNVLLGLFTLVSAILGLLRVVVHSVLLIPILVTRMFS